LIRFGGHLPYAGYDVQTDGRHCKRRARRQFTDAFKSNDVRLVLVEGKTVGAPPRDLDLTETALRDWVTRARANRTHGRTGLTAAERTPRARQRKRESHPQFVGLTVGDAMPPACVTVNQDPIFTLAVRSPAPGAVFGAAVSVTLPGPEALAGLGEEDVSHVAVLSKYHGKSSAGAPPILNVALTFTIWLPPMAAALQPDGVWCGEYEPPD